MTTIFMDNFEVYGQSSAMIDGMYGQADGTLSTTYLNVQPCLFGSGDVSGWTTRKILPTTYTTLFGAIRIRMATLPTQEGQSALFEYRDTSNTAVITLGIDTTGRLVVWNNYNTDSQIEMVRSAAPVIVANTWQFIEWKVVISSGSGYVEVRVDDNDTPVITASGNTAIGNLGSIAQSVLYRTNIIGVGGIPTWITDYHIWDTTGTRNKDFLGDVAVTTLWPNQDVETGWTPNYRHKIGKGVLSSAISNSALMAVLSFADSATLDIGIGDYTLETFIRFDTLPSGSNRAPIFQKWYEDTNQRSYELSLCGPALNSGNIEFRISTDGNSGSVQTIISQPWVPEIDRWYHVAVVRASGETMLFIDGIMQGIPQADSNTYYNGTAKFVVAGGLYVYFGGQDTTVAGLGCRGWYDETRFTNGFARYTENFVPTTVAFGRTITDDPQFADVVLLMGYDNGIADESSYGRSFQNYNTTFATFPDDGTFQYQTINAEDTKALQLPRDDTNISASFYYASSILTLADIPTNNDTVSIGNATTVVYKFVTTLTDAFDVLIGATTADTLSNLVAAINEADGAGTVYGTGTTANTEVYAEQLPDPQCKVIAMVAGTSGNSIAIASSSANAVWDGATLTGGADIPDPSSFRFTRMPPGVTTIRSVMAVTRAYKTESGPAKIETNFVGPDGAKTTGTEVSLSVEPAYYINVFEEDPDTSGPITPATLVQGRVEFDRTE